MSYYTTLAVILLAYMSSWFLISLVKKRNDFADVAWGIGFILLAWLSYFLSGATHLRGVLISVLISIWGIRLAWHIYIRNRYKTEDYRYLAWRKEWGKWFYLRSFFQIYILQGILLFLIVLPTLYTNRYSESGFVWIDAVGLVVWIIGFCFEVVGDAELAEFIKNPANKGKLMQSGLWAYTRHPNYFGEVTMWWGIWIIALATGGGLWTIIGPLTITFLILKVSGIPMLEKKIQENPDFEDYKRRTSVFIPLPRRK